MNDNQLRSIRRDLEIGATLTTLMVDACVVGLAAMSHYAFESDIPTYFGAAYVIGRVGFEIGRRYENRRNIEEPGREERLNEPKGNK